MATPSIAIYSATGLLPVRFIQAWIPSAQVAIDRDFAPHWGGATLRYAAPGTAIESTEWQLVFLDHSDQAGALGIHELTDASLPIMRIFFKDCLDSENNWQVTATHEIYETIADPFINKTVTFKGIETAVEVCDPPEDDQFAERVAGHMASNFVLPSWFDPLGKPPFTAYPCPSITKPFELAPGGYIGERPIGGQWSQKLAREAGPRQIKKPSSRTLRQFNAA